MPGCSVSSGWSLPRIHQHLQSFVLVPDPLQLRASWTGVQAKESGAGLGAAAPGAGFYFFAPRAMLGFFTPRAILGGTPVGIFCNLTPAIVCS